MPIRFRDSAVNLGRVANSLDAFSSNFDGTAEGVGTFTGSISRQLVSFLANFDGQYQESSLKTGTIGTSLGDVLPSFGGTSVVGTESKEIWLTAAEIAALPTSGTAFSRLTSAASASWGSADLSALDNLHDTYTLAGALYAARTGDSATLIKTRNALVSAVSLGVDPAGYNTVLELARGLQAYIIAADLIGYRDSAFVSWVTSIVDAVIPGHSGANSLRETAQFSANNWGCHARASLAAAAVYLEDATMLADVVQAQQEYIGTYTGGSPQMIFSSTSPDQDWHFDLGDKAGVNRLDAGFLSGVLPEEWRRDTTFDATTATVLADLEGVVSTYLWEGIQGFIVAAVILHREGSVPITSGDNAVERAIDVLIATAHPAEGDDRWIPWLANQYLGTNYDTSAGIQEGKGMGWTDWTGEAGTGSGEPYDLTLGGTRTIPFSHSWATPPTITSEATVTPASIAANKVNGRRLILQPGNYGSQTFNTQDQEIVFQNGAYIQYLNCNSAARRLRFVAESVRSHVMFGAIYMAQNPPSCEDIMFDGLWGDHDFMAGTDVSNFFHGQRISVINCRMRQRDYCVAAFPQAQVSCSGMIFANNNFEAFGTSQAGSRLTNCDRLIFVDNRMSKTGSTHNTYRLHSNSANNTTDVLLSYTAGNQFEGQRAVITPDSGSGNPYGRMVRIYFEDNDFYSTGGGLLTVGGPSDPRWFPEELYLHDNRGYSDSGGWTSALDPAWSVSGNTTAAATTPPAWNFR